MSASSSHVVVATADMADIEPSKENIQPLKQGHNLNTLIPQLTTTTTADLTKLHTDNTAKLHQYNTDITQYTGDDLLVPYLPYIQYLVQTQTVDHNHTLLITTLERCTRALTHSLQHKNDQRYIRVWLLYADQVRDYKQCCDIFTFMAVNQVGTQISAYYIAYSQLHTIRHQYTDAAAILQRGLDMGAQPVGMLKNALRRLNARAEQRKLNAAEQQTGFDTLVDNNNSGVERHALGVKRTVDENNTPVAVNGVQPFRHNPAAQPARHIIQQQPQLVQPRPQHNFAVHTDDSADARASHGQPAPWTSLSTQAQVSKENQQVVSTWQEPLKGGNAAVSSTDAAWQFVHANKGRQAAAVVDVFEDEIAVNDQAAVVAISEADEVVVPKKPKGLSQKIDAGVPAVVPVNSAAAAAQPSTVPKSVQPMIALKPAVQSSKPLIGLKAAAGGGGGGMNQLKSLALGKLTMKKPAVK